MNGKDNKLSSSLSLLGIGALLGATVSTSIMIRNIRHFDKLKTLEEEEQREQQRKREEEEEKAESLEMNIADRLKSGQYLRETFGLPSNESNLQQYREFVSCVDYARKIPYWVAYTINRDLLNKGKIRVGFEKRAKRSKSKFSNLNVQTPHLFQCDNADYMHSGWDRGHLTPAADHPLDQAALDETFYLTANIVPQDPNNNREYWYRVENWTRSLTKNFDNVHVITGPLFMASPVIQPDSNMVHNDDSGSAAAADDEAVQTESDLKSQTPENGSSDRVRPPVKIMQYPVIGQNDVHVPTHLFRVVLCESSDQQEEEQENQEKQGSDTPSQSLSMAAFILPNAPIDHNVPLTHFQVPLEELEQRTGFQFFQRLKDEKTQHIQEDRVTDLCKSSQPMCKLVAQKVVDMWNLSRSLQAAKSRDELEHLWQQMKDRELVPDKWAIDIYEQKSRSFDEDRLIEST